MIYYNILILPPLGTSLYQKGRIPDGRHPALRLSPAEGECPKGEGLKDEML